jgi:plasmid stabilization system protein ParE
MSKIIWTPRALDDIDAIAEFISRDSVYHASLFVDRIIESANKLKIFPMYGRIIPEIGNPNCREIIYGSYRIMYRIDKHSIWITGIIHGAKNWKPPVD